MTDKDLIVKQDNIFWKIKNFFYNIFFKRKDKDNEQTNQEFNPITDNQFFERVNLRETEEEKRISKLQQDLKNNKIAIEDISDDDFEKIIELYKEQTIKVKSNTEELKKKTDFYKQKIIILRKELNSY